MSTPVVPSKTALGQDELRHRTHRLSQRHRTVLLLVDGRRSLGEVLDLANQAGAAISHFEELVRYSETNIPRDDGLVLIPGEDLFYFTTGRRPRFPVLLFDHTTNPYSPEEIAKLCRDQNIRWVIVKQDLQLEEDPVEHRDRLIELLEKDFEQVESLNNYDIYRRSESEPDEAN